MTHTYLTRRHRRLKLLTTTPVEDSGRGVYSHAYFGGLYLAGGASNVGGAAIRGEGYGDGELADLEDGTVEREAARVAALSREEEGKGEDGEGGEKQKRFEYYYPLPRWSVGERFPSCMPDKRPWLGSDPVCGAADRGGHLHRLLCSIAKVEAEGYEALAELGAGKVRRVFSAGGGAASPAYMAVRRNHLNGLVSNVVGGRGSSDDEVEVEALQGPTADAAFGAARLALRGGLS